MQVQSGSEVALARGVSLLSQGRVDDTIAHYRQLTRDDPERAAYQNELGYVLLRAGRAPEALEPLQQAAALDATVAQTHNSLGVVHAQAGRFDAAVAAFGEAIALQPDYPEAQFNLAQLQDRGRGAPPIRRKRRGCTARRPTRDILAPRSTSAGCTATDAAWIATTPKRCAGTAAQRNRASGRAVQPGPDVRVGGWRAAGRRRRAHVVQRGGRRVVE